MLETTNLVSTVNDARNYLLQILGGADYSVGIVMGTGLEAMASKIAIDHCIPYTDIPGFPISTVSFHKGNLLAGTLSGKKVLAMQGRFHFYEGYSAIQVTFPIRVLHSLGIKTLIVSNAAGGMNLQYKKGDLVVIDDHINLLPDNPLRGISDPSIGERFVDMCMPYDTNYIEQLVAIAASKNIRLHKGVYVAVQGPNLETRAEYRWLRSMGADVVGMSTVPEIIVANQLKIKCLAVSVVTDECNPDHLQPINIAEIINTAGKADIVMSDLFANFVAQL